jgi:hypothetical protein
VPTLVDLTFDLADLIGTDFDTRRTKVYIETNVDNDAIVDPATGAIRLGDAKVTLNSDGTGSFADLWATNSTGTNPTGWQYRVFVDYARASDKRRVKWTSGWFSLTATTDLADVVEEQFVPPTYLSTVTELLDGYVADAEAARDAAVDISNISTSDEVVEALVLNTGGAGPLTTKALVGDAPRFLSQRSLSLASGSPTESTQTSGSTIVPTWQLPKAAASSVSGLVTALPRQTGGVKIEAIIAGSGSDASASNCSLRAVVTPMKPGLSWSATQWFGNPNVTPMPFTHSQRSKVLEAYVPLDDSTLPLAVRVTRESADQFDAWGASVNLAGVKVTPVAAPPNPETVVTTDAYNAWPMTWSLPSGKLVCAYSKRTIHGQPDSTSSVVMRTSVDDGVTWSAESTIRDNPSFDDSTVGRGYDSTGRMLLWVRTSTGNGFELYRSADEGGTWVSISSPVMPHPTIQITDVFSVPTVGLMSFWMGFTDQRRWGIVTSADDGLTWSATTVEATATTDANWPTEISGAYIGGGKIIAIGRSELADGSSNASFYQLTSADYGATWSRNRTNITDIYKSTPSVIWDGTTLHLYYYRRLWGTLLKRKVDDPGNTVWGAPRTWPDASIVAIGGRTNQDDGNVNAVAHDDGHKVFWYGQPDAEGTSSSLTGIYVATSDPAD